jgi:WD40 repeat protein
MTGSPESDSNPEVFDFVSMFCADRAEGTVRTLSFYQQCFPGHEAAIAAEFERMQRDAEEAQSPAAQSPMRRIGHYEVVRTLGSGGQGVVLLAEDKRLRRRVALKVLAPHLEFVSTERLQRFRREAEILSQLDHPGICQVYEADTQDGVPYLAMRFVEGRTLAAILRERRSARELPRTRLQLHEVTQWIATAARAVHEAHENGVVHRDIKPGNLMITTGGTPVLLDFGLARSQGGSDVEITRTGDMFGTLAYMAPELLSRRGGDHRADVYALGVTLYECLTHALPFRAESQTSLWRAIEAGQATPPRQHNPAVPPDLAAVMLTAMAASPTHRYQSAADFADDLDRVRRREPIHARAVPLGVRALRWVQRHPTLSLGLTAAAVLIVSLATSLERVSANERAASALNAAIQPSGTDEGAAAALAGLVAAASHSPRADLRNAMLQVLDACHLSWQAARPYLPPFAVDPPPCVDATGRVVGIADHEGCVTLRDTGNGRVLVKRQVHPGPATGLLFVDAGHLASVGSDGLRVLAAADLAQLAFVPLPPSPELLPAAMPSEAIAMTADGARVAVALPGALVVLATADWSLLCRIPLDVVGDLRRVAFASDGRLAVVLGREGGSDPHGCNRCWIVDTVLARVVQRVDANDQAVLCADWHPRLPLLALGYNGGRVEVRDAQNGTRKLLLAVGQEVNWCGFDPSGELLLVPSDRGTDLWKHGVDPPQLAGHLTPPAERTIGAAQFDRERGLFAAQLRDGLVLVYATADWKLLRQFKVRVTDARFLCWLPHSGSLLTADLEHLSCWLAGVRPHSPELWGHRDAVTTVAMHQDGKRVFSGSRDRTARLWSLDEAAPLFVFEHPAPLRRVRFCADGTRALTVAEDFDVRVFDVATGTPLPPLHGHAAAIADAWFLDADRVLSIGDDGRAIVWDVATGAPKLQLQASNAPLRSAAVHPQLPLLAVGGADRHVTVWDLASGAQVRRMACSDSMDDWRINPVHQVRGIAFDPGSGRLYASLVNNFLLGWDIADWREQHMDDKDRFGGALVDEPRTGAVLCADYSFGRLSLWRRDHLERLLIDGAEAHSNRIAAIRIDARGEAGLSAAHDGQLFVWDLRTGEAIEAARTAGAILDAEFSPDGRWVVTGGADGRIKLWPRDPMATAREYLARRNAGDLR